MTDGWRRLARCFLWDEVNRLEELSAIDRLEGLSAIEIPENLTVFWEVSGFFLVRVP